MKKYRIEITAQDPYLSVIDENGDGNPQVYTKIKYADNLDKAIEWAKNFAQQWKDSDDFVYIKTEIKEFEFVRDIPVDF